MDSWAFAAIAVIIVAYAALSRRLQGSPVSAAMFFLAAGLIAGNEVLDLVDFGVSSDQMRLLAEATLTLVLFSDASRLDLGRLRGEITLPARLLGIGLPLTIVVGAALAVALIPGLGWAEAAILAIVLAPTDAALGQAVVSDRRLPSRIRQGLNVESGLNDGICVPLLVIMLAVAEAEEGATGAGHAVVVIFEEIGYGIVGGVIAGAVGALVLRAAVRRGWLQEAWLQILIVALAALSYAIAAPLGGSGFIAAYVGGLVFGALRRDTGGEVSHLLDEVGELLNGATFIVFGAVVVGAALTDATWELALYAVLSLTVIRMLPVAVAMVGLGARRPTVAFLGWFGPRGLASIVFAVIVLDDADLPHTGLILTAAALTVALSVLAHGVSAPLLTERYVRWHRAARPPIEGVAVHEQPTRWGPRQ